MAPSWTQSLMHMFGNKTQSMICERYNTDDPRQLRVLRAIRKQSRTMTGAALAAIYLSLYGKFAAAPGHFAWQWKQKGTGNWWNNPTHKMVLYLFPHSKVNTRYSKIMKMDDNDTMIDGGRG